jgi:hypothetical protein
MSSGDALNVLVVKVFNPSTSEWCNVARYVYADTVATMYDLYEHTPFGERAFFEFFHSYEFNKQAVHRTFVEYRAIDEFEPPTLAAFKQQMLKRGIFFDPREVVRGHKMLSKVVQLAKAAQYRRLSESCCTAQEYLDITEEETEQHDLTDIKTAREMNFQRCTDVLLSRMGLSSDLIALITEFSGPPIHTVRIFRGSKLSL